MCDFESFQQEDPKKEESSEETNDHETHGEASVNNLSVRRQKLIAATEKVLHELSDTVEHARTSMAQTVSETFSSSGKIAVKVQEIIQSTADALQDEKDREIEQLKQQLQGMEILLNHNAALEKEVTRLCAELDEASMGIQKRGFLYKWREREIYYAAKWALRYFVLHGNQLSYYGDENERRPRRTIDLSKCYVKEEGTKKNGQFHVFSIYLTHAHDDSLEDTLLLKLSSESVADAAMWVDILGRACAMQNDRSMQLKDDPFEFFSAPSTPSGKATDSSSEHHFFPSQKESEDIVETTKVVPSAAIEAERGDAATPPLSLSLDAVATEKQEGGQEQRENDCLLDLNSPKAKASFPEQMLSRLQSTRRVLQRSLSRQGLLRRLPSSGLASPAATGNNEKDATAPIKKVKAKAPVKAFPAYKPMHTVAAPSPLSGEVRHGEYNFRGFFNLGVIILVVTHCDLIVNNLSKYGFKFSVVSFLRPPDALPLAAADIDRELLGHAKKALLTWVVSILLSYFVEKIASKSKINERVLLAVNVIIGTFNILAPCFWVWTSKAHPGANLVYLFQSVIIWMKLISYAHANKDLRVAIHRAKVDSRGEADGSEDTDYNNAKPPADFALRSIAEVKDLLPPFLLYPQNITIKNLLYFLIAPTLCYQLNYPRTPFIRWNKVIFLVARMFFVAVVMVFSVEQYIKPNLEAALEPMNSRNAFGVLETLLKLCIPSTYVWLLGFYLYFHCWLNFLAEITRFGDRMFYKDWWNAKTIDRYWRTWNLPVHHWVTRHLYYPLLRAGCNRVAATFVVFAFSALMHELVVSVPFQYISFHAFVGMMAQAPLISLAKYLDRTFDNPFLGNALFWCTFCIVGQPMGVMLYYYEISKMSVAPPLPVA